MEFTIQITGLEDLIKKINNPELMGKPLRSFLNDSMNVLIEHIIPLTPVDTAGLRGKITNRIESVTIDSSPIPLWAQLKPIINYGVFVEEGTKPHWTSVKNLIPWAHRHGMNPYAVQRAIAKRGTKGAHMFQEGLENSGASIEVRLSLMASEIETEWGK